MRFWGGKKEPKCEHLVKYNGRTLEVLGINYGDFQIGRVATESKLVQSAIESLMLLDAAQYHRCITISNISDERIRNQEYLEMSKDGAKFQRIVHAIISLSHNPNSEQLQGALKSLLLDTESRVEAIKESSQALLPQKKQDEPIQKIEVHGIKPRMETDRTPFNDIAVTVSTDKSKYRSGETITITGKLNTTTISQPLLIQVITPTGNRARVDQFNASHDGSFNYSFAAGGLMGVSGVYVVIVSYKTATSTTEFTFQVDPEHITDWRRYSIKIANEDYPVRYKSTGAIVEEMSADPYEGILSIQMSAESDGSIIIEIPRSMIDSSTSDGGSDDEFVVFIDDVISTPVESVKAKGVRFLEIPFERGSQRIVIMGTWMVGAKDKH